jgi:hypothetical protein
MAGRISYYGNIVKDGLILDLDAAKRDSYPGTGTTWNDISGNQNNGTLVNGPTFNSGNGGSIVFDGVNDYSLTIFNTPKSNLISINLWLKHLQFPVTGNRGLFQAQSGGTTPSDQIKTLGGWVNSQGTVRGRLVDTAGDKNLPIIVGSTIILNTWYYFSYIADGSRYNLYINGEFKTQIAYNGTIANYDRIFLATQGVEPSNCNIAQTLIYNRALSATEVLQNYNATKARYL